MEMAAVAIGPAGQGVQVRIVAANKAHAVEHQDDGGGEVDDVVDQLLFGIERRLGVAPAGDVPEQPAEAAPAAGAVEDGSDEKGDEAVAAAGTVKADIPAPGGADVRAAAQQVQLRVKHADILPGHEQAERLAHQV